MDLAEVTRRSALSRGRRRQRRRDVRRREPGRSRSPGARGDRSIPRRSRGCRGRRGTAPGSAPDARDAARRAVRAGGEHSDASGAGRSPRGWGHWHPTRSSSASTGSATCSWCISSDAMAGASNSTFWNWDEPLGHGCAGGHRGSAAVRHRGRVGGCRRGPGGRRGVQRARRHRAELLSEGFHRQPFVDLAVVLALVSTVGSLTFARMMEHDPDRSPPRRSHRAARRGGGAGGDRGPWRERDARRAHRLHYVSLAGFGALLVAVSLLCAGRSH